MGGDDAQNPVRAQRPVEGRSASQSEPGREMVVQMAAVKRFHVSGVSEGGPRARRPGARGRGRARGLTPYSIRKATCVQYDSQVREVWSWRSFIDITVIN